MFSFYKTAESCEMNVLCVYACVTLSMYLSAACNNHTIVTLNNYDRRFCVLRLRSTAFDLYLRRSVAATA